MNAQTLWDSIARATQEAEDDCLACTNSDDDHTCDAWEAYLSMTEADALAAARSTLA